MTIQEFINLTLGKQIEYHSFGSGALNQCVDLANYYIKNVLNLTPVLGANAKDYPTKFTQGQFEWIVNTPEAIIKKGDIPIWNGNVGGGAGHIAIATEDGTLNSFKSLDQNWSQKERVTLETHNYNNVTGWLRPKGGYNMANMYKGYDLSNAESMKVAVDILVRVQNGEFVDKAKYNADIDSLNKQLVECRNKPTGNPEAEAKLAKAKQAFKDLGIALS